MRQKRARTRGLSLGPQAMTSASPVSILGHLFKLGEHLILLLAEAPGRVRKASSAEQDTSTGAPEARGQALSAYSCRKSTWPDLWPSHISEAGSKGHSVSATCLFRDFRWPTRPSPSCILSPRVISTRFHVTQIQLLKCWVFAFVPNPDINRFDSGLVQSRFLLVSVVSSAPEQTSHCCVLQFVSGPHMNRTQKYMAQDTDACSRPGT